jgi:hypothetical protein
LSYPLPPMGSPSVLVPRSFTTIHRTALPLHFPLRLSKPRLLLLVLTVLTCKYSLASLRCSLLFVQSTNLTHQQSTSVF